MGRCSKTTGLAEVIHGEQRSKIGLGFLLMLKRTEIEEMQKQWLEREKCAGWSFEGRQNSFEEKRAGCVSVAQRIPDKMRTEKRRLNLAIMSLVLGARIIPVG